MSSFSSSRESYGLIIVKIVYLLSTLSEDRYGSNQAEIRSLCEQHGVEAYLYFIRRLIVASASRLQSSSSSTSQQYDTSSALTFRLLVQETQRLARDPFLADCFHDAVNTGEGDIFRHFDLARFVERVELKPLEQLILASSVVSGSNRRELTAQAALMVRVNLEDAARALVARPSFEPVPGSSVTSSASGSADDLTPQQLARLLSHLLSDPPPDSPILDPVQRVKLISAAQVKFGQETIGPILRSIFPKLSLSPGTSLVEALCQLGPGLTSDPDTVLALLQRFGLSASSPPHENQVVQILSTLARYSAEGTPLCDVASLIMAICSMSGSIDWCNVLLYAFDHPGRPRIDTATLKLLAAIFRNTPRDSATHSICAFWKAWRNTLYQLRLLDALLSLPNDTFNLVSLPGRRIVTVDDVAGASSTIKALVANVQGHTWNSLDLIETLVRLGDSDAPNVVQYVGKMLNNAVKISAELVYMGLLQVARPWGPTQQEYSTKLLNMFLAGHPNHQLVFMRIWQIDSAYLTWAFSCSYAESPANITRILDVAQDSKILDSLLDVSTFVFALDVAALASRRGYLNLDKWLSDHATTYGEMFIHAVLEFLDVKINSELERQDPGVKHQTVPLNPQTITIFICMLRNSNMSPTDAIYFTDIQNLSYRLHPRLMNLNPGSDGEPGLTFVTFSPEIETEVETIYRRMYDGNISVGVVIDMLRESKNSTNPRENEIFACTLHSLFDEYKFFRSSYPAQELVLTGHLFGSIIQFRLIDSIPLGIALRYVLDAVRSPPGFNLFMFGIEALIRFESRLPEWPPLCNALLQIPHFQLTSPAIAERVRHAFTIAKIGSGEVSNNTGEKAYVEPLEGMEDLSRSGMAEQHAQARHMEPMRQAQTQAHTQDWPSLGQHAPNATQEMNAMTAHKLLCAELAKIQSPNLEGKIDYDHRRRKGRGSFGDVYMGKYVGTAADVVCVKELSTAVNLVELGPWERFLRLLKREVKIWHGLEHRNVVKFIGWTSRAFEDTLTVCLISTWCSDGNVKEYLAKHPEADRQGLVSLMALRDMFESMLVRDWSTCTPGVSSTAISNPQILLYQRKPMPLHVCVILAYPQF
ncbi:uncharacterized protein EI90DRAFT_3081841 [Cantharellus anzutake]|uniref:uncharacterized protein n=1 Tax=Cantharellus anzutake TaxID=1750568 RepID=UPI0019061936|nr:uncharacterized protein EI90DRAFT_3081841 [Cantharellus anzutake]KAF8319573.1 hypothetical protein EI90DRAFT_3081841 [Cantharellus anzutake]